MVSSLLRVILIAGHGISNAHNGLFDPGASGCGATEAEVVAAVADNVINFYYHAADPSLNAIGDVTVVPAPLCSDFCANRYHAKSSHLAYLIRWCNEEYRRGDLIISLHMDESANPDYSGVLVVYDDGAPASRRKQAGRLVDTLAKSLALPNRGVQTDRETPRKHIGILEKTKAPSLLIELGFISNAGDLNAVRTKGRDAVIAGINALVGCSE